MLRRLALERRPRRLATRWGAGLGAALMVWLAAEVGAAATTNTNSKTTAPTTAAKPSATRPVAGKPSATPAVPATPPPGAEQMSQLAFLTGSWVGHLAAMPIFMDITINGKAEQVGGPIKFKIKATPPANAIMKVGLEGDYSAVAAYSTTQKAVRAVVTDVSGHGVEMLGEPDGKPTDWLFNSTAQGAPFPFKVRVRSVSPDQVVVNYSSGGRMPLTYEVTFNRVNG